VKGLGVGVGSTTTGSVAVGSRLGVGEGVGSAVEFATNGVGMAPRGSTERASFPADDFSKENFWRGLGREAVPGVERRIPQIIKKPNAPLRTMDHMPMTNSQPYQLQPGFDLSAEFLLTFFLIGYPNSWVPVSAILILL
jgi:hypothetical protein